MRLFGAGLNVLAVLHVRREPHRPNRQDQFGPGYFLFLIYQISARAYFKDSNRNGACRADNSALQALSGGTGQRLMQCGSE